VNAGPADGSLLRRGTGEAVTDDRVPRDADREFSTIIVAYVKVVGRVWMVLLRSREERLRRTGRVQPWSPVAPTAARSTRRSRSGAPPMRRPRSSTIRCVSAEDRRDLARSSSSRSRVTTVRGATGERQTQGAARRELKGPHPREAAPAGAAPSAAAALASASAGAAVCLTNRRSARRRMVTGTASAGIVEVVVRVARPRVVLHVVRVGHPGALELEVIVEPRDLRPDQLPDL
jgi:hypothetical protein